MLTEKPKNKPKNGRSRRRLLLIFIGLLVVLLMGAGLFASRLPYLFPKTLDLSEVQAIHFTDRLTGSFPLAPIEASYTVWLQGDEWRGDIEFSLDHERVNREFVLVIPNETIHAFLDTLDDVQLLSVPYQPIKDQGETSSYQHFSLFTREDVFQIYSYSQGEFHVPWGARIDWVEYTIDSAIPAEALAILEPYLMYDVLEAIIEAYGGIKLPHFSHS